MILKRDLLEAIDCLTVQVALQGDRIRKLETEVFDKKAKKRAEKVLKSICKEEKAKKASKQPRTKDGKFAKKK